MSESIVKGEEKQDLSQSNRTSSTEHTQEGNQSKDSSIQGPGQSDNVTIVQAARNFSNELESMMDHISAHGSAISESLYKAADDLCDALDAFIKLYELCDPSMKEVYRPSRKYKVKERVQHETIRGAASSQAQSNQEDVSNFKDYSARIFNQLKGSLKQFEFEYRDFQDFYDSKGEEDLKNLLQQVTLVHDVLASSITTSPSGNQIQAVADKQTNESFELFVKERGDRMTPFIKVMPNTIQRFVKKGIPSIVATQKHSRDLRFTTSSVAAFFAGVVASTLQYTIAIPQTRLVTTANSFWLASLIFSIASPTTALLIMSRPQAMFTSPVRNLSWHVVFWSRHGYLVLLMASIVTFVIGLLTYVYDTQSPTTFWTISGIVSLYTLIMAIVFLQLECELSETKLLKNSKSLIHFLWSSRNIVTGTTLMILGPLRSSNKKQACQQRKVGNKVDLNVQIVDTPGISFKKEFRVGRLQSGLTDPSRKSEIIRVNHMSMSPQGIRLITCSTCVSVVHGTSTGTPEETREFDECRLFRLSIDTTTGAKVTSSKILDHDDRAVRQVVWAPSTSQDRLFATRARDGVRVWKVNDESEQVVTCQNYLELDKILYANPIDVVWVDWQVHRSILIYTTSSEGAVIRIFDVCNEQEQTKFSFPIEKESTTSSYSYVKYDIENHLVFSIAGYHLGDDKTRIDSLLVCKVEQEEHGGITQHINTSSMNEHGQGHSSSIKVVAKIPLAYTVEFFTMYPNEKMLVISYEHRPPELWSYIIDGEEVKITKAKTLIPGQNHARAIWDDAYLIGPNFELVVGSVNNKVYLWDRATGDLKGTLDFEGCPQEENPVTAWSSTRGPTMVLVGAWGKGEMAICSNAFTGPDGNGASDSPSKYEPQQQLRTLTLDP